MARTLFTSMLVLGLVACDRSGQAAEAPGDTAKLVALQDAKQPALVPAANSTKRTTPKPVVAPVVRMLSSATRFSIATLQAITSRTAKAGDSFTATVVEDVRDETGRVVLPATSMVTGTITAVKSAPNPNSSGTLTLVVNSVTVRGKNYPITARIDSLSTERRGRGVTGGDAVRVGAGAAAGAIVGQVITKNTKGTVIGAAVGAVAGGVYAAATKDSDVRLPEGTHVIVTLTQPLTISGN